MGVVPSRFCLMTNLELPTDLTDPLNGFLVNDDNYNVPHISFLTDEEMEKILTSVCKEIMIDCMDARYRGDPKEEVMMCRPVIKHMFFRNDDVDIVTWTRVGNWSDEKVLKFASANF